MKARLSQLKNYYLLLLKVKLFLLRLKLISYCLLFLLLQNLFGCVTFEKCQEKYGSGQDSIKVLVPVKVLVPPTASSIGFTKDLLETMPVGSTITSQPTGPGKTKSSITKKTEKEFDCSSTSESYEVHDTIPAICPPVNLFNPEPKIIKETPMWNKVLIWFLLVALIVQSFRAWVKINRLPRNLQETSTLKNWVRRKLGLPVYLIPDAPPLKEKPSIPTMHDNGLPS